MKHDIVPNPSYIYETRQTETAGYDVGEKILQMENKPTAIYCANDITAVGILKAMAKSKNKYINISVISSDDIEQAQFTKPMLTTVALLKGRNGTLCSISVNKQNKRTAYQRNKS